MLTLQGANTHPVWSPDGESIAFASNRAGEWAIYVKSAERKGDARLIAEVETAMPFSWSPDGKVLALADFLDTWLLALDGPDTLQPLRQNAFHEWGTAFSSDGNWIAYTSDEQDQYDVYVIPFPPTGESILVSTEGGEEPVWSQTTNELYYRNGRKWMVAGYSAKPRLTFDVPEMLFEGNYLNISGVEYDASPDGRRFLLLSPVASSLARPQLNVITNWFEEVRRKLE